MAATDKRKLRHKRLRKKLAGTIDQPRLSVHFSGRHINVQVINDDTGKTIVSANTTESSILTKPGVRANVSTATELGKLIAQRGAEKNITKVVFDRGGFKYHGKVKALADAAREGGLQF